MPIVCYLSSVFRQGGLVSSSPRRALFEERSMADREHRIVYCVHINIYPNIYICMYLSVNMHLEICVPDEFARRIFSAQIGGAAHESRARGPGAGPGCRAWGPGPGPGPLGPPRNQAAGHRAGHQIPGPQASTPPPVGSLPICARKFLRANSSRALIFMCTLTYR